MWPDYFKYKKLKLYNIVEVFDIIDNHSHTYFQDSGGYFLNKEFLTDFLEVNMEIDLSNKQRWNYSFVEYDETEQSNFATNLATSVVDAVIDRYADEIFLAFDENDSSTTLDRECFKRVNKLLNILNFTYPKYSALLSAYDTAKTQLMAGVGWTESESIENSQGSETSGSSSNQNLLKINDTPQIRETTPTQYDTDAFVSEYHKDNGSESHSEEASLSGTIERSKTIANDKETKIERLAELEKKYAQVWRNWLNEFDKLFTSEENY